MPGSNCSIFGCSTSRKHKGIAIFKLPSGDDEYNKVWREKLVNIITKDRKIDASLKKQIQNKNLHICELHYSEDSLIRNEKKTTRIPGSLPTLNLPQKSVPSSLKSVSERSTTSIEKRVLTSSSSSSQTKPYVAYKSFEEFFERIKKLKLPVGWSISMKDDLTCVTFTDDEFEVPKFKIYVKNDLDFKIFVFNWKLPENHTILTETHSSFSKITLSLLIQKINVYVLCKGVEIFSNKIVRHCIPKSIDPFSHNNDSPTSQFEILRTVNCYVLTEKERCKSCHEKVCQNQKQAKISAEKAKDPLKPKAPLSLVSPDRIKTTLQSFRIENKCLLEENKKLQSIIEKSAVATTDSLDKDLKSIMSNTDPKKVSPFMKFFWQEQQKYLQSSSTGVRYHPAVIRYCLSLAAKSSSFYEDIRYNEKTGTGFLILPSQRRLRDYRNYIRPKPGFNYHVINELITKTAYFSDAEKYIVLLLDEMKIQENLVWDKHTGELIGYVDLGDQQLNRATLENVQSVATHVLVFMLRSIINPFKFSLANFATTGATSFQLFPLFWKAVSICELTCGLKMIAVTCDGASTNRKLFSMHSRMTSENDLNPSIEVTYRTRNLFSPDRYIYFISDPPHLIKTARNCLLNSGSGLCSRFMWNNGDHILWSHVKQMFYDDQNHSLHLLPKLTYDHIHLTSYSKMNVRLAAQVLSSSMSKVLLNFGPKSSSTTAQYCQMIDSFFDIVNIRNTSDYLQKLKPLLEPFSSPDDPRLDWLTGEFLDFFKSWLKSIQARPGKFTKTDHEKMFISRQTYEGLQVTAYSVKECVQFLLKNGICSYVLKVLSRSTGKLLWTPESNGLQKRQPQSCRCWK